MDSFESAGTGAGIMVALGVLYRIYMAVNHKHLRSRCCGRVLDAAIDVDETGNTPVKVAPAPENAATKQNGLSIETPSVKIS